ncbi:hypothetical protein [Streptomyces sp. MBT53]|uniref:hypothetical protein n=1 Tax=Streptomyces sp. MBT53 TaxID=1488384 RepID=UPI001911A772|nr:hypothetical protein [Streptomyces sp. MBT53]MBK6014156.1 hypothetical protein [Streptomyces sp. MBT53]
MSADTFRGLRRTSGRILAIGGAAAVIAVSPLASTAYAGGPNPGGTLVHQVVVGQCYTDLYYDPSTRDTAMWGWAGSGMRSGNTCAGWLEQDTASGGGLQRVSNIYSTSTPSTSFGPTGWHNDAGIHSEACATYTYLVGNPANGVYDSESNCTYPPY